MSEAGEKSFEATDERKESFRKRGQYAKSRDAGGILAMAGVIAVLLGSRRAIAGSFDQLFHLTFGNLGAVTHGNGSYAFSAALGVFVGIAGPCALAAAIGSTAIGAVQSGMRVDLELV
ncbi:MAG: EscU/YscU/HrcU family type III secretion system export apparatus switch protein, partial [Polyangiaceae bacterium]